MPGWDVIKAHTGIRRTVSLHSENVYKDNLWFETSVKTNYIIVRNSDLVQTLVTIGNTYLS